LELLDFRLLVRRSITCLLRIATNGCGAADQKAKARQDEPGLCQFNS